VADAAMVYLVDRIPPGGAPNSLLCDALDLREGTVILLLNADEQLVGFEILGASHLLLKEVLAAAGQPNKPSP
jgi:hypothetical protein